jgi:predicted nucleotidyltransferase component of viral defense system
MSIDIIQQRLDLAKPESPQRQDQMLREILQEIALSALSQAGFFKTAAFHGGTCLRIIYGLRRFSEDLDFILKMPDPDFSWKRYSNALAKEFSLFGIELEIKDRTKLPTAIKSVFIKHNSVGKILSLTYPMHPRKKLAVKLEIDTNPPAGSQFEIRHLTFPTPFSVLVQNLTSGMANKLHALLCRSYTKGRDWFDFLWYLSRKEIPDFTLLQNALIQQGPWAGQELQIDKTWLLNALETKIRECNWDDARRDVSNFLERLEQRGLKTWGIDFFISQLEHLEALLDNNM